MMEPIFHRVISGFMIQGGDPLTAETWSFHRLSGEQVTPGYSIDAEFNDIVA